MAWLNVDAAAKCRMTLARMSPSGRFRRLVNGRSVLRIQAVDATHALNRSAGVSKFNAFRGLVGADAILTQRADFDCPISAI